jgi:hypothetical protein
MAAFGKAESMFMPGEPEKDKVRWWLYTSKVDEIYALFKSRRLTRDSNSSKIFMIRFYGRRQFSIRDPNGYTLIFLRD